MPQRTSQEVFEEASALLDQARYADARSMLEGAIAQIPDDPNLSMLLARALGMLGEHEKAKALALESAARFPDHPVVQANLGAALIAADDTDGAILAYTKAVAGIKDDPRLWRELAGAQNAANRFAEAEQTCRRALELFPDNPGLVCNLAFALAGTGRPDDAVRALLPLAPTNPADRWLHESIAYIGNYTAGCDPAMLLHAHQHFGKIVAHTFPTDPAPFANTRDPNKKLRVGILSSDLGKHVVADFLLGVYRGLDRERFELFSYSTVRHSEDDPRRKEFAASSTFRELSGLPHDQMARAIRDDAIDILIETNGLTRGHVLPVLSLRAAPVQVTYAGYPNTTGVQGVDARIVDQLTDPPASDPFHTERLYRMPGCFLCYRPLDRLPDVAPPPCLKSDDAPITFASFNNVRKTTWPLLRTWVRLLETVPNSRLVLKSPSFIHEANGINLSDLFRQAGGDPSRLRLMKPLRADFDHLDSYKHVDVALDSFPYHGTTTTCEALVMGVPVVSFAGQAERPRHCSRVGLSLLSAIGRPEWSVTSADAYVRLAADLASDRQRLARIRSELRPQLLASPLCDTAGFGQRFADTLRRIWADWCDFRI